MKKGLRNSRSKKTFTQIIEGGIYGHRKKLKEAR